MSQHGSPRTLRSRTPTSTASFRSTIDDKDIGTLAYTSLRRRQHLSTSSSSAPPIDLHRSTFLGRLRKRPRLVLTFLGGVVLVAAWLHWARDWLVLVRFKYRDRAYDEGWIGERCGLRKRPMMFVRAEDQVALVWESNCEKDAAMRWGIGRESRRGRRWGRGSKGSEDEGGEVKRWEKGKIKRVRVAEGHVVYSTVLRGLQGGTRYAYELGWEGLTAGAEDEVEREGVGDGSSLVDVLASHSFVWTGPTAAVQSNDDDLARSNSALAPPATIHIAALADNQFNLRTFHRVLVMMLSYSKSLPSRLASPPLLFHAGDQVQNPHNLAQWQTDFWDAMTSVLSVPLGQTTPVVLARGNHDWDRTGLNAYTGGSPPRSDWLVHRNRVPRDKHPGTYFAYSPHRRCRVLVLDSNLDEIEQVEQEEWFEWEMRRPEWRRATLRIVMVHVPPFLEYWDRTAWTTGNESQWSIYVRHRLSPLWSQYGAMLVLSGHQHAYSRGFLPHSLHRAFTLVNSSSSLDPFARATIRERGWEKKAISNGGVVEEEGTIYAIFGGAGGTLDTDRVEDWGFYEASVMGQHHFGWIGMGFAGDAEAENKGVVEMGDDGKKEVNKKRVYRVKGTGRCEEKDWVIDVLEWRAISLNGKPIDAFRIESHGCRQ